jgi:tetratricopeptide (TPR) repeat protein
MADNVNSAESQLAITYYKDQEHEKAFKTFLEALDECPQEKYEGMTAEENTVYDLALKIYLQDAGLNPIETAVKIQDQFASTYKNNPHFHQLGYLLSVSNANTGDYTQFFKYFFNSYKYLPNHFLAYKSKAALHIKLFERALGDEQREKERQEIQNNVQKAIELEPHDTSLYRMALGFAPENLKPGMLSNLLKKIIDKNIVIQRIDIPYYVEMAIAFEKYDEAQSFINKAKEWYSYSRVIVVAQQRLDEKNRKFWVITRSSNRSVRALSAAYILPNIGS